MNSLRHSYRRIAALVLVAFIVGGVLVHRAYTHLQASEELASRTRHIVSNAAEQMTLVNEREIRPVDVDQWQRNLTLITQDLDGIARVRSVADVVEARRLLAWSDELFALMRQNPAPSAGDVYLASLSTVLLDFTSSVKALHRQAIEEQRLAIDQTFRLLILCALMILLFTAATGFYLYRHILRPLDAMGSAIQSYGAGRREVRSPLAGVLELDLLADSFNCTADQLAATTVSRDALESLVEQLRQNEHALSIAKEAAETANRAKSTFLATMSHELRTPMNGIMGMTAMALRKATDPKQMDQLAKATQSGEKLLALINDILEFSKADAESFALDVAPFILADVLESVTSQDGQKASDKGLAFHVEIDSDLASRPLMGDRPRLEHILLALTGNAIKFTSQGSVTVRVQATEDNPQDLLLRFEVQDTGIGISAEDQSRLFTAFQQVDGSMTRKYGGSGLGLALSQRLARAMGGDMGVDSQIGAGSTFWLTVRLGKSASAVPPAAA
jgi:signal transduction histidine kinase